MKTHRSAAREGPFPSRYSILLPRACCIAHVAQYASRRKGPFNPIGSANLCAQEVSPFPPRPAYLAENLANPRRTATMLGSLPTVKISRGYVVPRLLSYRHSRRRQFVAIGRISISSFHGEIAPIVSPRIINK